MPSPSESPAYPNTAFLEDVARDEQVTDLARAVFVTDFFTEGSISTRALFSDVTAEGFLINFSDMSRYDTAAAQLDTLMQGSLSEFMANSSDELGLDSYAPEERERALGIKSNDLMQTWGMLRNHQFLQAAREQDVLGRRRLIAEIQDNNSRRMTELGGALLYLDYLRLDPAHDTQRSGMPPPTSRFREAVLHRRTSSVYGVDNHLSHINVDALQGCHSYGLRVTADRWSYWYPGQDFLPANFKDDTKLWAREETWPRRVQRSLFATLGSRMAWRQTAKELPAWDWVELASTPKED